MFRIIGFRSSSGHAKTFGDDRVAQGGYPPQAPTAPYGHTLVHTVPQIMDSLRELVDDARCRQRITFYQSVEQRPREFALTIPAIEPLEPSTLHLMMEPL